jgi:hypothetical protein
MFTGPEWGSFATYIFESGETSNIQTSTPLEENLWQETVVYLIAKAKALDLSDLEVQQALLLLRPYPSKTELSSLVALMICTKLSSSQDYLTPVEISECLSISLQ